MLLNCFRADHRTQLRQTVHPEREPQQDPGPQQGDSESERREGPAGKPGIMYSFSVISENEMWW